METIVGEVGILRAGVESRGPCRSKDFLDGDGAGGLISGKGVGEDMLR